MEFTCLCCWRRFDSNKSDSVLYCSPVFVSYGWDLHESHPCFSQRHLDNSPPPLTMAECIEPSQTDLA